MNSTLENPRSLKQILQNQFLSFVDRRNTSSKVHKLTQRNLYVFPSKIGFTFLAILVVLWLIGTNYQNNLILALVFALLSIFLLGIIKTYINLAGITVNYIKSDPVFAGEFIYFSFEIENKSHRYRDAVEFRWQNDAGKPVVVSIPPGENILVRIPKMTHKRGIITPGRLLIKSYYPLGVFRCWTWIRWQLEEIVYPSPKEVPELESIVADEEGDGVHPTKGGDDYDGLKEYRPGDSLKHIAWKSYAKEKGLFTKEFSQNFSKEIWLDFDAVKGNTEQKLSGLTYWTLFYHQRDENFGLNLPGQQVSPNKGEKHKDKILKALSLFN